jgi:hypothetical protein
MFAPRWSRRKPFSNKRRSALLGGGSFEEVRAINIAMHNVAKEKSITKLMQLMEKYFEPIPA